MRESQVLADADACGLEQLLAGRLAGGEDASFGVLVFHLTSSPERRTSGRLAAVALRRSNALTRRLPGLFRLSEFVGDDGARDPTGNSTGSR